MKNKAIEKKIPVFNSETIVGNILIRFDENTLPNGKAKIFVTGMFESVFEGTDFYDAFMCLREALESDYAAVMGCKGCLKQAHTSGLLRDWSNGLSAYITDEKTLDNESVFIFDGIEANQVKHLMTIDNQRAYRKKFRDENRSRYIKKNKDSELEMKKKDEENIKNGNSWLSGN